MGESAPLSAAEIDDHLERRRRGLKAVNEALRSANAVARRILEEVDEREAKRKLRLHALAVLAVEQELLAEKRRTLGGEPPTLLETIDIVKRRGYSAGNPLMTSRTGS